MTDDDALLRAVLAAPDDDAPRLVHADWLDEHGQPDRARFIRTQIELARLPAGDPRRPQLVQVERTLLKANLEVWTGWLPAWAHAAVFRRGFLERIRCEAGAFISNSDEVRLRTPLNGVQLDGHAGLVVTLFRTRVLEGIRFLTLSVPVQAGEWEHLAASPFLGRLEELNLNSKGPPGEMVEAFVKSTALPALTTLRLTWCTLGDEHTARLVGHPSVARLRRMDLANNHIAAEGGQAIADSPHLDQIEFLNLRGNPVTDTWVAELLRRRFGGRVRL